MNHTAALRPREILDEEGHLPFNADVTIKFYVVVKFVQLRQEGNVIGIRGPREKAALVTAWGAECISFPSKYKKLRRVTHL